jgi:hypothetical protein
MKHLKKWKKIAMIGAASLVVGATSVTGLAAANTQTVEDSAVQNTVMTQTANGNEDAPGVMNQVRSAGDVENGQSGGNGTCDRLCDGTGEGTGNGYGDGTCDGDGVCDGTGNGYGDGDGYGVCDGDGTCDGTGNGNMNKNQIDS